MSQITKHILNDNMLEMALGLHAASSSAEIGDALLLAIDCNKKDVVDIILSMPSEIDLSVQDFRGHTALMRACYVGDLDLIITLIERGSDVQHMSEKGSTPLSIALTERHKYVCKVLVEHGAKPQTEKETIGLKNMCI